MLMAKLDSWFDTNIDRLHKQFIHLKNIDPYAIGGGNSSVRQLNKEFNLVKDIFK